MSSINFDNINNLDNTEDNEETEVFQNSKYGHEYMEDWEIDELHERVKNPVFATPEEVQAIWDEFC